MWLLLQGGLAYSQTYEGARAVAGSDAMGLSRGTPGRGRTDVTPIAENLYFNFVPGFKPIRKAAYGRKASVAASAGHRVGALAMSGVANGKVGEHKGVPAARLVVFLSSGGEPWRGGVGKRRSCCVNLESLQLYTRVPVKLGSRADKLVGAAVTCIHTRCWL